MFHIEQWSPLISIQLSQGWREEFRSQTKTGKLFKPTIQRVTCLGDDNKGDT